MDGVARLLADRLAELRFDGQPVRAVALRHERAVERLAVDRAADLHEPARAEELRRVVHHDAGPRTWVVALLEPGVELSQHDTETTSSAAARLLRPIPRLRRQSIAPALGTDETHVLARAGELEHPLNSRRPRCKADLESILLRGVVPLERKPEPG